MIDVRLFYFTLCVLCVHQSSGQIILGSQGCRGGVDDADCNGLMEKIRLMEIRLSSLESEIQSLRNGEETKHKLDGKLEKQFK